MLNTAMELEQQSHDFYTAEAADGPAKEFLLRLAKEELDHLELIRSFGFNLVGIGIPLR
jgi:rubrerythrin